MTDASHRYVADLLFEHTGQQMTDSRLWRIDSALAGLFRERGISNVDQLVCMLAEHDRQLLTDVIEGLLNNETYFFRDPAYFDILRRDVLPQLAQQRSRTRRIAIWSAGCSTGQEVLSLAMLFSEQSARWEGWTIDLLGTDISGKAIAAARQGHYSQFEIQRGISVTQMLQFFDERPGGWQAKDSLREMTRFRQASVFDPPPQRETDIVLCRNMLLYFEPANRARAFERLHESVASDGYLMLGAGETVMGQTDRFASAECGGGLYRPTPRPAPTQMPERTALSAALAS